LLKAANAATVREDVESDAILRISSLFAAVVMVSLRQGPL